MSKTQEQKVRGAPDYKQNPARMNRSKNYICIKKVGSDLDKCGYEVQERNAETEEVLDILAVYRSLENAVRYANKLMEANIFNHGYKTI